MSSVFMSGTGAGVSPAAADCFVSEDMSSARSERLPRIVSICRLNCPVRNRVMPMLIARKRAQASRIVRWFWLISFSYQLALKSAVTTPATLPAELNTGLNAL